jgi:factor associated with neutral sphingomyelinase activation
LIFGVKQDSFEDNNVFHPCTYQHKVKQSVLNDPVQRRAFEVQISEFGQTPKQIFFKKHPQKYSDVFKPTSDAPKSMSK